MRFFGARSPSKIAFIGAEGAFRKILGSVGQKWISEKVSKGGPFGSAGGQIPEGGGGASAPPPPLPKSAPAKNAYFLTLTGPPNECFPKCDEQPNPPVYLSIFCYFLQ